jgi:hypothetical protein
MASSGGSHMEEQNLAEPNLLHFTLTFQIHLHHGAFSKNLNLSYHSIHSNLSKILYLSYHSIHSNLKKHTPCADSHVITRQRAKTFLIVAA